MNKKEILYWCDSVENTWKPREDVPRGENPQLIPESFLATAIRYLRELCDHNEVAGKAGDVCGKCLEGKIQHTSFMKENDEITIHVYGCNGGATTSRQHTAVKIERSPSTCTDATAIVTDGVRRRNIE